MEQKINFLKTQLVPAIAAIPSGTQPAWGKMNLQQMTEHLSRDAVRVASGKLPLNLVTPAEHVEKMQAFIRSDKAFRENTVNALMPSEPPATAYAGMEEALEVLQQEIDYFFSVFEQEPARIITNPFFGDLDFELQVLLLYKHAQHHLRQFGIQPS